MKEDWIDTRLTEKEMNFLRDACSGPERKKEWNNNLAGNISKSEGLVDKDNWFFKSVLKKLTERLFYRDWDVYYRYYIEKEEPPPKFEMNSFWVNYQKQYEFNPIHNHTGLYSFVIFMKIPIHWKEQHALPININSTVPCASDFEFILGQEPYLDRSSRREGETGPPEPVLSKVPLGPEDEGRMLFFPAGLHHQVYPFYECEEERVTISGNIDIVNPNIPDISKVREVSLSEYEEKENMLKILQDSVQHFKEELKHMKKNEEK